jgi:hypothetical protein
MTARPLALATIVLFGSACTTYRPPTVRTSPVPATAIESSVGRTWDAVVEYVAERLLAIEVIDRSSGLLAVATRAGFSSPTPPPKTTLLVVGDTAVANCGSQGTIRYGADQARYNILVRGDSTRSTVMVNAAFKTPGIETYRWCVSTGRFEEVLGERIRVRAQRR